MISNFVSTTKTEDIDFLIPDIKKKMVKVNLYEIFEKNDYFSDISREGIVVFRKDNFEVECLVPGIKRAETIKSVLKHNIINA